MNAPMVSFDFLDAVTPAAVAGGLRVFQGYRVGQTDEDHVLRLLEYMAPPENARILDAGCGIGEVARIMNETRPDLDFVLLNRSAVQLSYAPTGMGRVLGDMHLLPLETASLDAAMFCYSLCHADFLVALGEAARVVRPGGFLFVYDYVRTTGDDRLFESRLMSRGLPFPTKEHPAISGLWRVQMMQSPAGDDAIFRSMYGNDDEYGQIFDDLMPVVWRAVRL